ncbi:MAG: hypothetical protein ACLPYS_01900 [Vulcanimicrobiaceae bacterium]
MNVASADLLHSSSRPWCSSKLSADIRGCTSEPVTQFVAGEGFALEHVRPPVRGQLGGRGILIAKSLARSVQTARVGGERFRVTVELPIRLSA